MLEILMYSQIEFFFYYNFVKYSKNTPSILFKYSVDIFWIEFALDK